jgi:hypothetical protein
MMLTEWQSKRDDYSYGMRDFAFSILLVLLALFWVFVIYRLWLTSGWFERIGYDFGCFWSATKAFFASGPAAAYDMNLVHKYGVELARLGGRRSPENYSTGVSPYPPLFFLLIAPFTHLRPVLDFLLWTACNVVLAAWVSMLRPAFYVYAKMTHGDWWVADSDTVLMLMLAAFVVSFLRVRALARASRASRSHLLLYEDSVVT